MKPASSYQKGLKAEQRSREYLENKGFKIKATRFKTKFGEIDLVAVKGKRILFCEIKFRSFFSAFDEIVSLKQQKRIVDSASLFLATNQEFLNYEASFGVFLITHRTLNFIPYAFS